MGSHTTWRSRASEMSTTQRAVTQHHGQMGSTQKRIVLATGPPYSGDASGRRRWSSSASSGRPGRGHTISVGRRVRRRRRYASSEPTLPGGTETYDGRHGQAAEPQRTGPGSGAARDDLTSSSTPSLRSQAVGHRLVEQRGRMAVNLVPHGIPTTHLDTLDAAPLARRHAVRPHRNHAATGTRTVTRPTQSFRRRGRRHARMTG